MSLFSAEESYDATPLPPRRSRASRVGWVLIGVAVVILIVLGVAPSPYVIDQPGPVYDTLGSVTHDGKKVPLISVPDQQTYPTKGALDLLTVSQVGNPEQRPDWFQVASAWFDPSKAVIPIDVAFPPNVSTDEVNQQSQAQMVDSQQDAIAAALLHLGYDFPRDVTVGGVSKGSPADGVLKKDDVITSLNGTPVHDIDALRAAVADNGTDKPAQVGIERAGAASVVEVTPTTVGKQVVLGVGVGMDYTFPFEVDIQLDNVGGPSAGQMFALGIIDTLTPGALTGGKHIAGTGTIDSAGDVGAIGGIRQKMFGAKDAGARYFLAPESNCDEVVGHVPSGLTVFAVKTLDDSLAALDAISTGAPTDALPTCR
ncbi:YlbL family protein [Rathayibacter sp. YIM 133350]|uniref:YlbL family protein n=1 Tax=Rathayibacter sp. YIM 133350 TaxID=3131992 RepID=UPI003FCFB4D8